MDQRNEQFRDMLNTSQDERNFFMHCKMKLEISKVPKYIFKG